MANTRHTRKIWHIGGEDVRMRIPLLLALREKGFEVGAVGSEDGNAFLEHGIPYRRYKLDRWIGPVADLLSFQRLCSLFSAHKPDIVHAFDTKPGIIAPLAAKRAGIPVRVRTICGMGYIFSSASLLASSLKPVYRFFQTAASNASTTTVFQNPDDRAYFRLHRMVKNDCDDLVLGSGIDIQQMKSACPDDQTVHRLKRELGLRNQKVVTMVTRLVRHKGVIEFIDAAKRIKKSGTDAAFLLVGPISSEGSQAVSIEEVNAGAGYVKYLGPRQDVPAILAISDLFVLPSYYREGVPRVLLEAGAMGLPLITTDMPGCKEAVRGGISGWLVKPRDSKMLEGAVLNALGSPPETLNRMGERSRKHIEKHFGLEKVADAYAKIYERALNNVR